MCGFLTYISSTGDASATVGAVAAGVDLMHHRGPDQTGLHRDGDDAVLGFKRLSIVDLEHSEQPLHYADRYVVTFNGEIYNHAELRAELIAQHGATFTTVGDTEVVVAAYHHWGVDALQRLRGMFAFVIWDRVERTAFGARDRFGIKPLAYRVTSAGAWFTSEPKALRQDVAPDGAALSHYLTYQYVPEPWSLHSGVFQVGAGECFAYTADGVFRRHRYWRPTLSARQEPAEVVQGRIRDALADSVEAHMRADVPVGAFLSSGIDSTAVVALARHHNPDLHTFTAALDVPGYSELDAAQETAAALGVRNTAVVVTAEMMMDALPRIVWHLDDPVADPALVPLYFVAQEAARHVTVVLSGEGADELFAGYGNYREARSLAPLTALPRRVRRALGAAAGTLPEGVRGRSMLQRASVDIEERYYGNARMFSEDEKRTLMRHYDPAVRYTDVTAPLFAQATDLDDVQKMQFIDIGTWLPGDILRKADRMSMAHSLELRVPFLDPVVFAAAQHIPTDLKLERGRGLTKVALRRALEGVVPAPAVTRVKLGFPTPIRVWLRGAMYDWAADILTRSPADELVDLGHGLRLLDRHRRGRVDHSRKIWTLLVFALWYETFVTGDRAPLAPV